MKKLIISFVSLSLFFLIFGCKKSFLDVDTPGKLSLEEFYKTDADALQATIAVYDMMQSDYLWSFGNIVLLKTFPSDESNKGGSGPGDQPQYDELDKFHFTSQNAAVLRVWRQIYYSINRANAVINKITPDSELKKRSIAEALALRAYNYLDLVTLWGDVPIVLSELAPADFSKTPRATKDKVYEQIEKDLKEAIPVLPLKSSYSAQDRFRMTKGAAQAILGKCYLFQERWDLAAEQFENVINSGEYGLEPDFGKIFSRWGEFGQESLFELSYSDNLGAGGRARESNQYIQLMGSRVTGYVAAPGDSLMTGGWFFNLARKNLYNDYVNNGDTKRRVQTVESVDELIGKGGQWPDVSMYEFDGIIRRKYANYSTETSTKDGNSPTSNFGTNWRLIRYADVLLMASESYYRLNDEVKSRFYLNKVRERAELPDVNANGTALFNAIVTERELELAFEGFRYVDLVRWGLASQVLGPFGYIEGVHNLLPIPDDDVRAGNLTQNPGY